FYNNKISGELTIPLGVTRIHDSALENNQISKLTILSSVMEYIDKNAFSNQIDSINNHTLTVINIVESESDWLSSVSLTSGWYDSTLSPTFNYNYVIS
ncbi:MAG: hypothetical protein PUD59_00870, partial [bacterium]|nr:hypothetical protein [bacterium]